MSNRTLAVYAVAALAVYLLIAWLAYVARYRQTRTETLARLIASGADRAKTRLLREEGI